MASNPDLRGEFGSGADGPTIFMVLSSQSSARWLRSLFLDMIESEVSIDLVEQPEAELYNIEALELVRVDKHRGRQLSKERHRIAFAWCCTDDEWQTNAELLDPFVQGMTGHQRLTNVGVDDAIVDISFGEKEVRVPGSR